VECSDGDGSLRAFKSAIKVYTRRSPLLIPYIVLVRVEQSFTPKDKFISCTEEQFHIAHCPAAAAARIRSVN
jgi:hypothetical protein